MKTISIFLHLLIATASVAFAFPPAPYYTLFGIVRDQVGQRVTAEGATIILLRGGVEIGRTPISPSLQGDQNYEMTIRIDQNRSGTVFYSDKAVAAQGLFSLVVDMNGTLFYPIEVSGNLTAGTGGERTRLDLNLGEDLDHDGLPDVWEQWQLYQAGHLPDANGDWDLSLIDRDGDFDKDGTSNLNEYIAGTFAGDATETFTMAIKEKLESSVRFEFYGITGKTYSIERSTDAANWVKVPFSTALPVEDSKSYTATDVGLLPAFTIPGEAATKEFFRLTVR